MQLGLWALGGGTCFAPSLSLSSTARLSLQLGFARGARWNPPVGIEHELPALRERERGRGTRASKFISGV